MKFSGALKGVLRGKKHYFQMEWIDLAKGFKAVDDGYNITVIEGASVASRIALGLAENK